jgi:heat shock protein HslJ
MLLLFLFLIISCKHAKQVTPTVPVKEPKVIPKDYGADLDGKWQVQYLWGFDSSKLRPAFLVFNFDAKTFTGNTGCNSISGKFSLKEDLLLIDKNFISTKMYCSGYNEKNFINLLLKINRFTFQDNILELSQDNLVLMSFKKE